MNKAKKAKNVIAETLELLAENCGIEAIEASHARILHHIELIREWNEYASLVSAEDACTGLEAHVADSLSLIPHLTAHAREGTMVLDIGSGAGFPLVPVKILLSGLPVVLIERSSRKVGFLRKLVGALQLPNVRILHGSFPEDAAGETPSVITARAVENPERVVRDIVAFMPRNSIFLCQSPDPARLLPDGVDAVPIIDSFTGTGLRRGQLHLVQVQSRP